MWKKVSFGIFIAFCLAGGIYWFAYIREVKTPVNDAMSAIPLNATIVIESRQSAVAWKKLSQTNIMWEELLGTEVITKIDLQGNYLDSLFMLHPSVSPLLEGHPVIISLHPGKNETTELLYLYSLPNLTHHEELEELILSANNGRTPLTRNFEGQDILTIRPEGRSDFHYCLSKGILIMSSSSILLESAIRQASAPQSLLSDTNFLKIRDAAGKKVDATIYVNYKYLSALVNPLLNPRGKAWINELSTFAEHSGWDVTIRPNALL
ncbi:MAG: hypothetical protein M3R27_14195, partial [Bacteroidota bacterium]|nr:hypothetical protein [Bacteroidota bacterium]